jgi:predicted GTPase
MLALLRRIISFGGDRLKDADLLDCLKDPDFLNRLKDPDFLNRLKDKPLQTICDELQRAKSDLENTNLRFGLIGEAGAGKSSLINAILGRPVARVGVVTVDHPKQGEEHDFRGVKLVDLPGCGGIDHPFARYVSDLKLLESGRYDGFLLVTANRLKENDVALYADLHVKHKRPVFVLRTHFDSAAAAAGGESAARVQIEEYFRKYLPLSASEHVYAVSAPNPSKYDLPQLLEDLCSCLSGLKRDRLLEVIPAYTEELLNKKRKAVEKVVLILSLLAGVKGLNPVPGMDVALDIQLLQTMTRQVIEAFGLTREQLKHLSTTNLSGIPLDQLLDMASPVLCRLAQGGIVAALRKFGGEAAELAGGVAAIKGGGAALKAISKYAPFIGLALCAGLGGVTAYLYGARLLNECVETARNILAAAPS